MTLIAYPEAFAISSTIGVCRILGVESSFARVATYTRRDTDSSVRVRRFRRCVVCCLLQPPLGATQRNCPDTDHRYTPTAGSSFGARSPASRTRWSMSNTHPVHASAALRVLYLRSFQASRSITVDARVLRRRSRHARRSMQLGVIRSEQAVVPDARAQTSRAEPQGKATGV